jgi:hypothetical protein
LSEDRQDSTKDNVVTSKPEEMSGFRHYVPGVGFEPTKVYATGSPRSLADSATGEIVTSPLESHVKDISSDSRLFKPFKSLQANQDLNFKP